MAKGIDRLRNLEIFSLKLTEFIGTPFSVIIHSILFVGIFILYFFGIEVEEILLILTTAVSLEAIYLAIFIQMTINRNTRSLKEVEKDVDEIQEDVDEIQKDVDEIQEDVDEIQKDVDEIQEDVDEIQEEDQKISQQQLIGGIEQRLQQIMKELQVLKKQ